MRHQIVLIIIIIAFGLTLLRTSYITLIDGSKYSNRSISLYLSDELIVPKRGTIADRNGRPLTADQKVYDVMLQKNNIQKDDLLAYLSFIDINLPELSNLITRNIENEGIDMLRVFGGLSVAQLNDISTFLAEFPELRVSSRWERSYRYPFETSHILGYVGSVEPEHIKKGYAFTDTVGKYRIEKQYEEYLKGVKGRSTGQGEVQLKQGEKDGDTVYLNIDINWQRELYRLFEDYDQRFGAAGGAGVIMNVSNGELISLVSYPGFDINQFSKGVNQSYLDSLINSRDNPLLDKAISSSSTPGSIFKLVTALSLLESGEINQDTTYFSNRCMTIGNSKFCEFGQNFYGNMNVVRALVKSSNVFFCNHMLNDEEYTYNLVNLATLFGVGMVTGIDLEGEVDGLMDNPAYKLEVTNDAWRPGDTCNVAIGQGAVLTTPIQMASIVSQIYNFGSSYKPRILKEIQTVEGNKILESSVELNNQVEVDQKNINLVLEGMSKVAYNPESSVYNYLSKLPNNVRAKTGSAETFENISGIFEPRVHSWIVGTFDYLGETYSFTLFQQFGGGGFYITPLLTDFLNYLNGS